MTAATDDPFVRWATHKRAENRHVRAAIESLRLAKRAAEQAERLDQQITRGPGADDWTWVIDELREVADSADAEGLAELLDVVRTLGTFPDFAPGQSVRRALQSLARGGA